MRLLVTLSVASVLALVACERSAPPAERTLVSVARPAGAWEGTGSTTIGLESDTGRFRIHWRTRNEHASREGRFRLTVHSAVSGRPLQVVVDHRGEGSGQADFADDPRPYNLMVDAADVLWSFSVDAIGVETQPPDAPR